MVVVGPISLISGTDRSLASSMAKVVSSSVTFSDTWRR